MGFCEIRTAKIRSGLVESTSRFRPSSTLPAQSSQINTSNQRILSMVQGAFRETALPPTGIFLWVDVRDVALAHIRAMETPAAGEQRFLLVGGHFSNKMMADAIAKTHPELVSKLPTNAIDDAPVDVYGYDGTKTAKTLGLEFRSFRDCVDDTVKPLQAASA